MDTDKNLQRRQMNSKKIVFITGGAKSGKSSFALKEASGAAGEKAYIATAEALDEEMRERIQTHKRQRGIEWDTYEEPIKIGDLMMEIGDKYDVIVLDCLTLWVSNLMGTGLKITDAFNDLRKVLQDIDNAGGRHCLAPSLSYPDLTRNRNSDHTDRATRRVAPAIYIVSNEVGMGIVPENEMARKFRDMAGVLNQQIAEVAHEVYMVVAGIPVRIK